MHHIENRTLSKPTPFTLILTPCGFELFANLLKANVHKKMRTPLLPVGSSPVSSKQHHPKQSLCIALVLIVTRWWGILVGPGGRIWLIWFVF